MTKEGYMKDDIIYVGGICVLLIFIGVIKLQINNEDALLLANKRKQHTIVAKPKPRRRKGREAADGQKSPERGAER